jgi:hypothetical protein
MSSCHPHGKTWEYKPDKVGPMVQGSRYESKFHMDELCQKIIKYNKIHTWDVEG